MGDPAGWTRTQRRLHGVSAVLVAGTFALGWLMTGLAVGSLLLSFVLYQLHKTLGLVVLILLAWRLAERARAGRPPHEPMPPWQRAAARAMQAALLVLLGVVPVLGYLTAATAPANVPTLFLGVIPVPNPIGRNPALFAVVQPVHRAAAIGLVGLASLHAAAAIRHHLRGGRTLGRMWAAR